MSNAFSFELPVGVVDAAGDLHRAGVMRVARAIDEVEALGDPRVRGNPAYLSVAVLSRVIERLGGIEPVPSSVLERLLIVDFLYLQELYEDINGGVNKSVGPCPRCGWEDA